MGKHQRRTSVSTEKNKAVVCRIIDAFYRRDVAAVDEWFATPVLANVREQPMLDLGSFAGTRRQVTNGDLQPGFIGRLHPGITSRS